MGIRAFRVLLASTALTFAGQALAQDTADEDKDANSIVVTGTRIVRDGYEAPTPVTVASTEELIRSTPTNIPDALNKLPQFQNSLGPGKTPSNFADIPAHGNILNLRGLGTTGTNPKGPLRTLVMFDGLRVAPTTYVGTVDANVIPNLLISRVDVVTGGASAAWGSDAVAGVVNFVLDRKFTGIKGTAHYGVSSKGDNDNYRLGLAYGTNFADDKGHLLLSAEHYSNSGMIRNQREIATKGYAYFASTPGCVNTTSDPLACAQGGSLNPYALIQDARLTGATEFGKITGSSVGAAFPFLNYTFNADGTFRPFVNGTVTGQGAAFAIGGDGYRIPDKTHTIDPYKTYHFFGRVDYEVAPDINVYLQGVYSRQNLEYELLANSLVTPATLFKGNPFIPAAIDAALPAGGSITVTEYNQNGPGTRAREKTNYWMATAGLEGKFADSWRFAVNYTHSETRNALAHSGLYDWRKTFAALDVVSVGGVATCNVLTDPASAGAFAGCKPLNILRGDPSKTTPDGYAYATGTSRYQANTKYDSLVATISGSPFELPAGPVDITLGAEYRSQSLALSTNADPSLLDTAAERSAYFGNVRGVAAGTLFYWLTNVGTANASLNVKEAFAEVAVPLLKDKPLFQDLSLNGAIRVTDYSFSGTVTTWKAGATWRLSDDILFRGVYSRDIRAPNLFELFAGDSSTISIVNDPVTNTSANVPQLRGGNPFLRPEVAKTLSFGTVLTPRFAPGLSLSMDYYRIRLNQAVNGLVAQAIVTNCFQFGPSSPECALITRPTPTSFPTLIRLAESNIAFINTSGIDFDASYRTKMGSGALGLRLYATYLSSFKTQAFAGQPVIDWTGKNVVGSNPIAYPKLRGSLSIDYSNGPFGITWTQQLIGKMGFISQVNPLPQTSNFINGGVDAVTYTDLTLSYKIPVNDGNVESFVTVNNLFNRQPPIIPGHTPGVNLPTNISVYDVIGMAFTAGVRFKF
jgi:iron complex outermembrane recepter protein